MILAPALGSCYENVQVYVCDKEYTKIEQLESCKSLPGLCNNPDPDKPNKITTLAIVEKYGKGHKLILEDGIYHIIKCKKDYGKALKEDMDIQRRAEALGIEPRYPVRERNFDVPPCVVDHEEL